MVARVRWADSHEEIAAPPGVETLPYGDVAFGATPGNTPTLARS
jgi:hypothetical protein